MRDINPLSIHWVSSADAIPADLWLRCFPPPLEGRWWYALLERSGLDDQFSFSYAVLERNGNPIGIAPTFLMNVPIDLVAPPLLARLICCAGAWFPRLRYQRTLFIGSPCADEGTVGLVHGIRLRDVAMVLQDAVYTYARNANASMVVWKDFPDTLSDDLDILCRDRSLFKLVSYPGTIVPRLEGSFDGYLRTLTSAKRNSLKRKLRRSRAMGELDASVIQYPEDSCVAEIFDLYWQTYQKGKTKFERLTPEFFRLIAVEDVSYFVMLRIPETGKLVAFMLCYRIGTRVYNKFMGFDYTVARDWYLYFRLWEVAVEWAATGGASDLQSGQTVYTPKLDLGHTLIPLTNYCIHLNPLVHHIFSAAARYISWSTLDDALKTFVRVHGNANEM
jgi:hypothetical protein